MRPVLLDLAGFGSFREPAQVDFAEADYFALVGPTGAGKSTVIDAITFALYGNVPRWDDKRLVKLALSPTATRGTVRLVFDVGPQRYVAVREMRRTAQGNVNVKNARLERLADNSTLGDLEDESDLVAADNEVTGAVERLLGLTFENFCTCVVLPQGDFADFLHARPADRQKILVKLLGLEVYEQIGQAANTEARQQATNAELLADQLLRYGDVSDEARRDAEARITALADAEARVATALPTLTAAADEARAARRTVARLTEERAHLAAVEVPAGLADLDAALRTAREASQQADTAVRNAETADSEARAALAAAPARGPLEAALRARVELDALVTGRPGLVTTRSDAAEAQGRAEKLVTEADRAVEQARLAQVAAAADADAARETVAHLTRERQQLATVRAPDGLSELDTRLRSAREASSRAGSALAEAEAADSAARAAVASAPPRGPVESARRARVELDRLTEGRPVLSERQADALRRATEAADAVRRAQEALDAAREAREAGARQRTAAVLRPHLVAGEPCPVCEQTVATLPPPLDDEGGVAGAEAAVREAQRAADAASADRSSALAAAQSAETALATADEQATALRHALGDRELLLAVHGEGAAPVEIVTLDDIDRWLGARDALDAAARAADLELVAARNARDGAERDAAKVDAEATGVRSALRDQRDALAPLGAPGGLVEDVAAGWAALASWAASAAAERSAALADAGKRAAHTEQIRAETDRRLAECTDRLAAARTAHTEASRAEQRAVADLAAADRSAAALTAQLGDAPDASALAGTLAELDALDRAARDADGTLRAARTALTAAQRAEKAAYDRVATTVRGLIAIREPLVPLGAPAIPSDDPVGGWRSFAAWAADAEAARAGQLDAAAEAVRTADDTLAGRERALSTLLTELGIPLAAGADAAGADAGTPPRPLAETAPAAVATALADARAVERRLAERRREAAELTERRDAAESAQQVARQLGLLLRSDAFPRWLVASALDLLVAEASATLDDLSGGQFALTHEAGEFVIVDHADADAQRPVKTLSGGETFQASLALALALSAHVSTMAASGAARLDSIFLDEGFGTLDEATLEVVAATLENLAAGGDRMVGLVTHVAALAERVPVRFEVSRDQRTSTVTKVMQ
ncbi:AAA family ATPase [Cryptosporangium sp. NPDC051539]|uniref:AAA family ATPase n=1 Tax=Cryptosporangium sp. NPDC051539 TaxID=3363962 RepID=UPI0037A28943